MDTLERVFVVDVPRRILICKQCRCGITRKQLSAHIRSKCHRMLSRFDRREISKTAARMPYIIHKTEEFVFPRPRDPSIPHIRLFRNAYGCNGLQPTGAPCEAVYRTVGEMQHHCKQKHGWQNSQRPGGNKQYQQHNTPNAMWRSHVVIQQVFKAGNRKYVEVGASPRHSSTTPGIGNDDHCTDAAAFFAEGSRLREEARAQRTEFHTVADVDTLDHTERIPWIIKTGIPVHIKGLPFRRIAEVIALPEKSNAENAPPLNSIVAAVGLYISSAFRQHQLVQHNVCKALGQHIVDQNRDSNRHFRPYKRPGTLKDYINYIKKAVCYFHRVCWSGTTAPFFGILEDHPLSPDHVFANPDRTSPTQSTYSALHALFVEPKRASPSDDAVRSAVGKFLFALLFAYTGADVHSSFKAPLLSYVAMTLVDTNARRFHMANNFSSGLSALVWTAQLLIYHCIVDNFGVEDGAQVLKQLRRLTKAHINHDAFTTIGQVLRWRELARAVANEEIANRQVIWNPEGTEMQFQGERVTTDQIKRLMAQQFRECSTLLEDHLLMGLHPPKIHARDLKDNPCNRTFGYSFLSEPANQSKVEPARDYLRAAICNDPRKFAHFVDGHRWREEHTRPYESRVQQFLAALSVLIQLTSGQPLREPEFFSMTWFESVKERSFVIQDNLVRIYTTYHKGLENFGDMKHNIRFLHELVGDLVVMFICYVEPLREIMLYQSSAPRNPSHFFFEADGVPYCNQKLSRALQQASTSAKMHSFGTAEWRHYTVSIVKRHFPRYSSVFEEEEQAMDGSVDHPQNAMALQRNHAVRTSHVNYADVGSNPFDSKHRSLQVTDNLVSRGRMASKLWSDYWELDTVFGRPASQPTTQLPADVLTTFYPSGYRSAPYTEAELLLHLRRLHKNPNATWKSEQQLLALQAVTSPTNEQLVIVMPTGSGKSTFFMLPATLPTAGTTVLVVPLISLRADLIRRLRECGIPFTLWKTGDPPSQARIVIVTAEAVVSPEFAQYAMLLSQSGSFDRIVIDEAHLTLTACSYRDSMRGLGAVRDWRTQFVYLTASLPPCLEAEFIYHNNLVNPTIIRASTNRPNILYRIRRVKKNNTALAFLADDLERYLPTIATHEGNRVLVYVPFKRTGEAVVQALDIPFYHGDLSEAEREAVLKHWLSPDGPPVLVTTEALSEGFDYAHVRAVYHLGLPTSMIRYIQETGRAGRDGKDALAMIIMDRAEAHNAQAHANMPVPDRESHPTTHDFSLREEYDRNAMHRLAANKQCIRTSISEFSDGPLHTLWCMQGIDIACDGCPRECHSRPWTPADRLQPPTMPHTGTQAIRDRRHREAQDASNYKRRLASRGANYCGSCHSSGQGDFRHPFTLCPELFFQTFKTARTTQGKQWLPAFHACFLCYQPQSICTPQKTCGCKRWHHCDPDCSAPAPAERCEYPDIIMPICWGLWQSDTGRIWIKRTFDRQFHNDHDYLQWLAGKAQFDGSQAIQAVLIAHKWMEDTESANTRTHRPH